MTTKKPSPRTLERTVVFEECYTCGAPIAMGVGQQRAFHEAGLTIHCVLGHGTVRRLSENGRLQKALNEAQERLALADTALHNEIKLHDATAKARRELEAEKKRIEKRVHNGVCPHCNRSFVNLKRHMTSKHKEGKTNAN